MHQGSTSLYVCVTQLEPVLCFSTCFGLFTSSAARAVEHYGSPSGAHFIRYSSMGTGLRLCMFQTCAVRVSREVSPSRSAHLSHRRQCSSCCGQATLQKVGTSPFTHLQTKLTLLRFKDWSEKYGEVFSLKIGRGTMIVLNSRRAVYDLLDKRSSIYSGRIQDEQFLIALKGENIANLSTDATWRAQRKITTRFFAPSKLDGELSGISDAE